MTVQFIVDGAVVYRRYHDEQVYFLQCVTADDARALARHLRKYEEQVEHLSQKYHDLERERKRLVAQLETVEGALAYTQERLRDMGGC